MDNIYENDFRITVEIADGAITALVDANAVCERQTGTDGTYWTVKTVDIYNVVIGGMDLDWDVAHLLKDWPKMVKEANEYARSMVGDWTAPREAFRHFDGYQKNEDL